MCLWRIRSEEGQEGVETKMSEEKDAFENDPAWIRWKKGHTERRVQELMTTESLQTKRILRLWMKHLGVDTPSGLIEQRNQHGDEETILKQYLDHLHASRKVQTVRNHLKAISGFYTYNDVPLSLIDFDVYKTEV
jgi:hypothetical protein